MHLKIILIIQNCISSVKTTDFTIAKQEIIENFNNINFNNSIVDYKPCDRKLYLTRPKIRELIRNTTHLLNQFFTEQGYNYYVPKQDSGVTLSDVEEIVEIGTKIIAKKQQEK